MMKRAFFHLHSGRFYVFFLTMIAAIPALSTDMYLAAIPKIAQGWGVSKDLVTLSLTLWFAAFSVFLLLCGTLSDKYGRRPVLLSGLGVFVVSTILCAIAPNVWILIGARIAQGIGAAAPSSMCMAICRDKYEGRERQKILAAIGVILAIAPIVAPSLGAVLLTFFSWRSIFVVQAVLVAAALLISLGYIETAKELTQGGFLHAFARYTNLFKNPEFMTANAVMGLLAGPFFAYISFSPIAYISHFGLSEQVFGLLYALGAASAMLGAFACTRAIHRFSSVSILTLCFIAAVFAGAGLFLFGSIHFLAFLGFTVILSFACGMTRPLSTDLILHQVKTDIGAASSFMVFYTFLVGAVCMGIATADWKNTFFGFGLISLIMPVVVLALWPILLHRLRKKNTLPA